MNRIWYAKPHVLAYALLPLAGIFAVFSGVRRCLYAWGIKKTTQFPVPVIVVGNITVGGTGKTPLVIWLSQYLQHKGWHPGIVLRGYGGRSRDWPQAVKTDSDPRLVGDEAVLLARRTRLPVYAAPSRVQAVRALLSETDCNLVISDDGLQHYALGRDMEIAVVDGGRGLGNGFLLPAGPLREGAWRLDKVDLVVSNGQWQTQTPCMSVGDVTVHPLLTGESCSLEIFKGQTVHAIAGIGHPQRFFQLLTSSGLEVVPHPFPDHHQFAENELDFADELPVLMTEKDAVKYIPHARSRHYAVAINLQPDQRFMDSFEHLLLEIQHG